MTEIHLEGIDVHYNHHCGDVLTTVNAARVSFGNVSQELTNKDLNLIHFLAEHDHLSPFNHAFISFKVRAPIFVARQLVKHEYMPWNEESRRYMDADKPPSFYKFDYLRPRAEHIKQGSTDEPIEGNYILLGLLYESYQRSWTTYNHLLEHGVCPEQARAVLPQGMNVNFYWSGTLGAVCSMLVKRLAPDAQKESREVAKLIAGFVIKEFGVSATAYLEHQSKQELTL